MSIPKKRKPKSRDLDSKPFKFKSQEIFDALPFQMAVLDGKGFIRRVNASWMDFGRDNNGDGRTIKGVGFNYLAACKKDRSSKVRKIEEGITKVLKGEEEEYSAEYPCHSPDEKRWFIMRVSALKPLGSGAVVAHFKITERVLAEKALQKTQIDLAQARDLAIRSEQSKTDFFSQMSHEIRTPLNGIMGMLEMLRDSVLTDSQKEVLENLDSLSDHLLGIVNDVLDLSKIEAGKFSLDKHVFNPIDVAQSVKTILNVMANNKGLKLAWECSADFPRAVIGDARRLRQILINLTGNALKFTEKGSVTLRGEVEKNKQGQLQLAFIIRDTGIGISPEGQKHLFQRFSQLEGSHRQSTGGTGLGLVISKLLAETMGGQIQLTSVVGQGSEFKVSIQVEPTEALTAPSEKASTVPDWVPIGKSSSKSAGSILVADDNEVNRKIMSHILEKMGWRVLLAKDGVEALEIVSKNDLTAIFMDCQMPRMDGYEATRTIRQKEALVGKSHLPIIAITADALEANVKQCQIAGMDEFLTKPFRRSDVVDLLTRLFQPKA